MRLTATYFTPCPGDGHRIYFRVTVNNLDDILTTTQIIALEVIDERENFFPNKLQSVLNFLLLDVEFLNPSQA